MQSLNSIFKSYHAEFDLSSIFFLDFNFFAETVIFYISFAGNYKMNEKGAIGLVILAAGESARMGKAKQLMEFGGKTMLQNAAETALASGCRPVIVVLGARSDILKNEIKDCGVQIVVNNNWQSGMSGSIKTGLEKLLETNDQTDGVVIMVCDQPFVSPALINEIVETFKKTNSLIVASEYAGTRGVPALFSRKLFSPLFDLENFGGAKKIIEYFADQTTSVAFEKGKFDIDTPEDYLKLIAG